MSILFNREKVMTFLSLTNKAFDGAEAQLNAAAKICKVVAKITSNEDLKVDLCNSLELICKLVEDRAIGLYDHYKDDYEDDFKEVMGLIKIYEEKLNKTKETDLQ
jgi:hypothetical protein